MVAHAFSSTIQDAEAGRSIWDHGQPDLHSEHQANQVCIVRSASKQTNKYKERKSNLAFVKNYLFLAWHGDTRL